VGEKENENRRSENGGNENGRNENGRATEREERIQAERDGADPATGRQPTLFTSRGRWESPGIHRLLPTRYPSPDTFH
jgi:hypothetical protein